MKHIYTAFLFFFILQLSFGQIVFEENIIEANNIDSPIEIHSGDIDGDGDMDVVVASLSNDKIFWYENIDGQGTFSTQNLVTDTADGAKTVFTADIDGDGDLDLLTGSQTDDVVAWYENLDGLGNFGTINVITTSSNSPKSVVAADLDGDGDNDVLIASFNDDTVSWYENTDGQGSFGFEQIITVTANGAQSVFTADFDNDGDLDVVSASFNDYEIAWYENEDGLGNFGNPQSIVSTPTDFKTSVYAADIDNDGDMDIISAAWQGSKRIAWYENTDGLGAFSVEHVISNDTANATSVFAGDLDNDGDIDVVTASQTDDTVAWYENIDGQGTYGSQQIITENADSAQSVFIADVDGDGDLDVLSASFGDSKVAWYKNTGILNNEIFGVLQLDINANGCDSNDSVASNLLIETTDGFTTFSTFSANINGAYSLFPPEGTFTTQIVNLPPSFTSSPIENISTFSGLGEMENVDFCIESLNSFSDINIVIFPSINEPRPGFDTSYRLVYSNIGTNQRSGSVVFEFDDTKLQFLGASDIVNSQSSNTLIFDYTDLKPFETRSIDLQFNVFAPPTTNIDDILLSMATINPVTGDETEEDNTFSLEQTVIGSYDPNDITCLEGDEILIEDADKYLHYLIRFQNTGTASAINVRVEHILDDKLDWLTMQLESLSHLGRVEIANETDVSFVFNNINLPDSTTDEEGSNGFIAFKIKPKTNVVVGNIISAVADIYFDFNPPIITNTVNTEIVAPLSVDEYDVSNIKLFPNPAKERLEVTSKQIIDRLTIVDINGRALKSIEISHTDYRMDVSNLAKGVYVIEIQSGNSKFIKKFLKN